MSFEFRDLENDRAGSHSEGLGCFGYLTFAGLTLAVCAYGPLDSLRVAYSELTNQTAIFKQELLDYSRKNIQREYPGFSPVGIETYLAGELGYTLTGETIAVDDVSLFSLLDVSEHHAPTLYQRWIWPSLKKE